MNVTKSEWFHMTTHFENKTNQIKIPKSTEFSTQSVQRNWNVHRQSYLIFDYLTFVNIYFCEPNPNLTQL